MNDLNILVTGSGGDIGQSIGKILSEFDFVSKTIGVDICDHNPAQFIFDSFEIGLRCDDDNYLDWLIKFAGENKIDVIIPASEAELRFFSNADISKFTARTKLIMANLKSLEIGFDKLKTARHLEHNNLDFPETRILSETNVITDFPVIVKARTGSGSKDVHMITSSKELEKLSYSEGEMIVQECISNTEGEFTCGVFRSKKGEIRTIIFKRELTGGYSGYGEVVKNNKITNYLIKVAESLDLTGCINMQLRLRNSEPVIFEINPRFSSTVRFRDMFGFKDVLWSLEDEFGMEISPYEEDSVGRKFYKGYSEYIK